MSDYRPLERWDYRVNDLLIGDKEPVGNRLLDDDGVALRRPESRSLEGLSAVAAALDEYGPEMTTEHLEKAVWWIKDWKAHRSGWYRTITARGEFSQAMEKLKNSTDFNHDGRSARRYSYGSHLVALLTGVFALAALSAWFGEEGWGLKTGLTIVALFLAGLTASLRDKARDHWQTQDRRYFLQCVRLARCTEDLLSAGLFAYDPKTMEVASAEDQLEFRRTVRKLQLQLADALYFDWDSTIRETNSERDQAYSWNWPSKAKPSVAA